jgi:hypothetical protein
VFSGDYSFREVVKVTRQKKEFSNIRHGKKRAFLVAYSEVGNISQAAELAGIDRSTIYVWKDRDPKFVAAMAEAEEKAADRLEQEARRRAVEGVSEPVFYQGEKVGTVQKYSDTLLIFLMKGVRPEKYRERFGHEITGKDGGPIETAELSPEERQQRISELLKKRGG